MTFRTLSILLLLAACDSPSPRFIGSPKAEVEAGGMRFSIHRRGDAVEAYRLGFIFRPSEAQVLINATRAIELSTGCQVKKLSGDQALVKAILECSSPAEQDLTSGT